MDPHPQSIRPEELLAHAGWLRALAATLTRDASTADDLVQDAWLAALRQPPRADHPLRPWLSRVVHNLARNRRRAELRRAAHEADAQDAVSARSPDELVAELHAQRALVEVLIELEEPLRSTIVMRYYRGMDATQIAKQHGVAPGTVRWRLSRGLHELRARLDARFGGSRANWCALLGPLAIPRDVATIGSTSALGVGAVAPGVMAPGVIAMGAMLKVGAAAAALVLAGWWLLEHRGADHAATPQAAIAEAAQPVSDAGVEPAQSHAEDSAGAVASSARIAIDQPGPPPLDAERSPTSKPAKVDARFVDDQGLPWSGVRFAVVRLESPVPRGRSEEELLSAAMPSVSGPDGRAEITFPGIAAQDDAFTVEVTASRAGCESAFRRAVLRAGETTHLGDIVLGHGASLSGRVVDDQGRPVSGARLGTTTASIPDDVLEAGEVRRHGLPEFDDGPRTSSGPDGRFRLDGIVPGRMRAWAQAEGTRFAWSELIDVRADVESAEVELALEALRREDRIAGRVVDPNGQPVADAQLSYRYPRPKDGPVGEWISTDEEGRFDILLELEVAYRIDARDKQNRYGPVHREDVQPGTLDLVLQLGELFLISARVRDTHGEPVQGCRVMSGRADGRSRGDTQAESDSKGIARVAVPDFAFRLIATARGYASQSRGPFDPGSPPEQVDFELAILPVLRGRVIADGKPVLGARMDLRRDVESHFMVIDDFECVMDPGQRSRVKTDEHGRFELKPEDPDRFWVRAVAEGFAPGNLGPFDFNAGVALDEVELILTRGGAIEGRVLLADGRSGEGTIVGINHGDGSPRTQRAGPDGAFRFEGLTPGKWQVLARTQEIDPQRQWVRTGVVRPRPIKWDCEVVAGRTTRHDLDLTKE